MAIGDSEYWRLIGPIAAGIGISLLKGGIFAEWLKERARRHQQRLVEAMPQNAEERREALRVILRDRLDLDIDRMPRDQTWDDLRILGGTLFAFQQDIEERFMIPGEWELAKDSTLRDLLRQLDIPM